MVKKKERRKGGGRQQRILTGRDSWKESGRQRKKGGEKGLTDYFLGPDKCDRFAREQRKKGEGFVIIKYLTHLSGGEGGRRVYLIREGKKGGGGDVLFLCA